MPSALLQTKGLCWIKTRSKLVLCFFLWCCDYMQSHIKRDWNTSLTMLALCSWEKHGELPPAMLALQQNAFKTKLLHFLFMLFIEVFLWLSFLTKRIRGFSGCSLKASTDKSDASQTGGRKEKNFPPPINSVLLLYLLLNKCLLSFSIALRQ